MALAFVQGAAARNSVSTITISGLSSATNGDILVMGLSHVSGTALSAGPAGWTLLQDQQTGTGFADVHLRVYWKQASAEPATYTAALAGNDFWSAAVVAFRGQNGSSSAIDANANAIGSHSAIACPSVTLSASGDILLTIASIYGNSTTGFNNATFTQAAATSANAITIIAGYQTGLAAGATGTVTWTASTVDAVSPWVGVTLGIIASSGTAPSTSWNYSFNLLGVGR